MVITNFPSTKKDSKVSKALADVKAYESGEIVLDVAKYAKAIEILAGSDIESVWFKLRPLFTERIKTALLLVSRFVRDHAGPRRSRKVTGALLKLNRKLSHYAQDEPWVEEMHIAAILQCCRHHVFFNIQYLKVRLKKPLFDAVSLNIIFQFVFDAPDRNVLIFDKDDSVVNWRGNLIGFLENMTVQPVPVIMIFLATKIEDLRSLHKDLTSNSGKGWSASHLPIADQILYYGKIVEFISLEGPNDKIDKSVITMLGEIKSFLQQIAQKVERKDADSIELVPVRTEI